MTYAAFPRLAGNLRLMGRRDTHHKLRLLARSWGVHGRSPQICVQICHEGTDPVAGEKNGVSSGGGADPLRSEYHGTHIRTMLMKNSASNVALPPASEKPKARLLHW